MRRDNREIYKKVWCMSRIVVFFIQSNVALETPHYYEQFALSLWKESYYIVSKFNLLNTDTPVILEGEILHRIDNLICTPKK